MAPSQVRVDLAMTKSLNHTEHYVCIEMANPIEERVEIEMLEWNLDSNYFTTAGAIIPN
jgi:hypothetical protein